MATIAEQAPPQSDRVSRAGWYALTLVASAQGLSLLDRQILSILAPSIKADLHIGDSELGLLYGTVFSLFYALFSLPLGRLVDGWIRTRLLSICIFAWSIFAGLSAFAGGFTLLAISRLGVGIGEAAAQPSANSIIFDTFPRSRRGTAMASMGIATALGLGLSMTLGGVVAGWFDARFPQGAAGFSGWQFAFLVAALPGLLLAWLISRLPEPVRGGVDGIRSPEDPHPFRASGAVLASVTPGINWVSLWSRKAPPRQWAINLIGLAAIALFCWIMTQLTQAFSPRPPTDVLGAKIDPHVLQWSVVGFGAFVILNMFQSLRLTDRASYNVIASPSVILLIVVAGLQTSINYGVMGFTPSLLNRSFGLSQAQTGLQFGLLSAGLAMVGPIVAGPLSDWLTARMGGRGRVWLTIFSLGISPLFGIWTYSAQDLTSFYLRFSVFSLILTLWLPPLYSLLYDLVLPRMRGVTSSIFIIITTLLGLGMGPYFVGIVSDRNGGDLAQAIISINVVWLPILACLFIVLWRVNRDETTVLDRARAGGEPI
uniref:MFS transporter n=1 Tax=Altererythrobacter segetis TaxID=1104773 RepID=UPI001A9C540B|nr:MFS transporter [Altererythrobacter segetis]